MKFYLLTVQIFLIAASSYASSVMELHGNDARAFFEAFRIESRFDGAYHTFKTDVGTFRCVENQSFHLHPEYECNLVQSGNSVLRVQGNSAKRAYADFNLDSEVRMELSGVLSKLKQAAGTLNCFKRTRWGAKAEYFCSFETLD